MPAGNADFLPASFRIETGGAILYIDPVGIDGGPVADFILITHGHPDHLSWPDIEKISDEHTVLLCPRKVAKKRTDRRIRLVAPGEDLRFDKVRIETVPAYSIGFPSHPKKNGNVGYVLTAGGVRIYHTGDTDKVPEIEALQSIDVALVPIDGGALTMTTPDAADLVNTLQPRIAIPMHYVLDKGNAADFQALVSDGIDVVILAE